MFERLVIVRTLGPCQIAWSMSERFSQNAWFMSERLVHVRTFGPCQIAWSISKRLVHV